MHRRDFLMVDFFMWFSLYSYFRPVRPQENLKCHIMAGFHFFLLNFRAVAWNIDICEGTHSVQYYLNISATYSHTSRRYTSTKYGMVDIYAAPHSSIVVIVQNVSSWAIPWTIFCHIPPDDWSWLTWSIHSSQVYSTMKFVSFQAKQHNLTPILTFYHHFTGNPWQVSSL